MSFRPPQSLSNPGSVNSGFNVLEYEMQAERAAALGRQGVKVEAALSTLAAWDEARDGAETHETLLFDAADAVWALFIQREMCGMRNNREIIKRYGIPQDVLARVGTTRKRG